jgi:Protein of unknown function (DUF4232)
MGMRETNASLLRRLGAGLSLPLALAAVLAGCSSPAPSSSATPTVAPGSASASAGPSASPTLSPPTSAPTSAPTPSGPQECTASELQGSLDSSNGAAGTLYSGWEVRDASSQACTLNGYFGVQMSAHGSQLPLTYTATSGNGVHPTLVLLQPNTAALNSGNDAGHAIFYMRSSDVCNSASEPDAFEFTPPHLTGSFVVSIGTAGMYVCGHVDIGPISPPGSANPFIG